MRLSDAYDGRAGAGRAIAFACRQRSLNSSAVASHEFQFRRRIRPVEKRQFRGERSGGVADVVGSYASSTWRLDELIGRWRSGTAGGGIIAAIVETGRSR